MAGEVGVALEMSAVLDLKDGDLVNIKWSGGNGPHLYIVRWIDDALWAFSTHFPDYPVDVLATQSERGKRMIHHVWSIEGGS